LLAVVVAELEFSWEKEQILCAKISFEIEVLISAAELLTLIYIEFWVETHIYGLGKGSCFQ
jgi:hypothetical protein